MFESRAGAGAFEKAVEEWREKGWVREVEARKVKVGDRAADGLRWWEGVGGVTKGLVGGLVAEIQRVGEERVKFVFDTTVRRSFLSPSESG